MERSSTKKRILKAALTLFAQRGYEAVRVAQIADAVGIKAPSLYKHFESKQAIFEAILNEMQERYQAQTAALQMDGADPAANSKIFANVQEARLVAAAKTLFHYYLHDEFAAPFRRMLTTEQFRDPKLAALFAKQYVEEPLSFQGSLFAMLSAGGTLKQEDADVMALHFYAPVFLMLTLCDCRPEMESRAAALIERNILQFERIYRMQPYRGC